MNKFINANEANDLANSYTIRCLFEKIENSANNGYHELSLNQRIRENNVKILEDLGYEINYPDSFNHPTTIRWSKK